jgi:hypothetical protein
MKRCVDAHSFQVCRYSPTGEFWDDIETCCPGYVCSQNGDDVNCVPSDSSVQPTVSRSTDTSPFPTVSKSAVSSNQPTISKSPIGSTNPTISNTPQQSIPATCVYRQMVCDTETSYRMCNRNTNGQLYWDNRQYCQPGFICRQTADSIYCIPPNQPSPEPCTTQNAMRCTPDNKQFQRCVLKQGSLLWDVKQDCNPNTQCSQSGNVIYCI